MCVATLAAVHTPVCVWVAKVKALAGVVCQDPGEDGPLSEIVEGPPCCQVAEEQIVQIAELALLPGCCHPLQPLAVSLQVKLTESQATLECK